MIFIYNILIHITAVALQIVSNFNHKIKLGVEGRKQTFSLLNLIDKNAKTIWFHCASLGEYEQGLPVFEEIKKLYPEHKIVLTFFSPSGYEIRQNSPIADVVSYLPLDTKQNAKKFLETINPDLIVFVKYEFWPNFLSEIRKQNKKAILISALFRENHSFFSLKGKWMQPYLKVFNHIFVQNQLSKNLLNSINYNNVTIAGDTRLDRVINQLQLDNSLPFIDAFIENKLCLVAGSTWPEDEDYIYDFIKSNPSKDIKYIIAPHSIKPTHIKQITQNLTNCVLFSEKDGKNLKTHNVFIIDTIGILSKIYSYADIAYVGGAVGKTGLHNILEPAVFGTPIIIGKNHKKYPEAQLMIDNGGVFSVETKKEFNSLLLKLLMDSDYRRKKGALNASFVKKNQGAVIQILNYIRK